MMQKLLGTIGGTLIGSSVGISLVYLTPVGVMLLIGFSCIGACIYIDFKNEIPKTIKETKKSKRSSST